MMENIGLYQVIVLQNINFIWLKLDYTSIIKKSKEIRGENQFLL